MSRSGESRAVVPTAFLGGTIGAAVLALALPLAAQEYLVRTYTVEQGLPSSTVTDMVQDSEGRLWFATRAGLAVYDGVSWRTFSSSPDGGVRDFRLLALDGADRVWAVSTRPDSLLVRVEDDALVSHAGPEALRDSQEARPIAFAVASAGSRTEALVALDDDRLFLWSDGVWRQISLGDGWRGARVRSLGPWQGHFLVATDRGLVGVAHDRVDPAVGETIPRECRDLLAIDATPTSAANSAEVWLASSCGIGAIRDGVFRTVARVPALSWAPGRFATVLRVDPGRSAYVGALPALWQVDLGASTTERLGAGNGLLSDGASALLIDRERNLWVAGPRGVSKLVSRRFANYGRRQHLLEDEVTAICQPRPGVLVLGHNNGLTIFSTHGTRTLAFGPDGTDPWRSRRVLDLAADAEGRVWVAATDQGLGVLEPDGTLRWKPLAGAVPSRVVSVLVDRQRRLWVAAGSQLLRAHSGRLDPVALPIDAPFIPRRIVEDRDGTIFVATQSRGLLALPPEKPPVLVSSPTADGRSVFAVFTDSRGHRWVGTRGGLRLLEGSELVRPSHEELRISSPVFFIIEDTLGALWFGTDDGVLRWDGARMRRFAPREGLAGRETNRAAALVDDLGNLWIGTEGGVSRYQPQYDQRDAPPPLIHLGRIDTGGRRLDAAAPIELRRSARLLEFSFRAASFLDEDEVQYRYFLEGFDPGWSDPLPAETRSVRYTNLPPGTYRFHVKAANAYGTWSEPVSSGTITITSAIWSRWWFLAALAGLLIAALVGGIRIATQWRYAAWLEQAVRQRTAELGDSESRYRQLFQDEATPKLLVDVESGSVADANSSACTLAGLGHASLVGRPVTAPELQWVQHALAADADPHGPQPISLPQAQGRGARELLVWRKSLTIAGRAQILVTAQDVTAVRRLQDEHLRTSKLESLALLAGGLAHDFNNIIAAALGNLSLARLRGAPDDDDHLRGAETALLRARGLTSQLLTFSRGGMPVKRLSDLGRVVAEAARFVLAGSASRPVLDLPEGLWPCEIDDDQIGQVISNLLINAQQAGAEGTIRITAENVRVEGVHPLGLAEGPYVKVAVHDNGSGIPAAIRERVFDPYFTTKERGSGLGLAVAYAVVRNHGGRILVESTSDSGTTMAFFVPARPDGSVPEAPREASLARGSGRVLVMDDEPELRRLYEEVLAELGYDPVAVGDGAAAIEVYRRAMAQARPFRCVIMDLTVPGGMGGRETLVRLRQLDHHVRALVASGYSNDPVMAEHRKAGFAGALTKPFTIAELARALRTILDDEPSATG